MRPKGRQGFSLIELLIVIAIISFLAAVAVPNFGGHGREGANRRACYANQRSLAVAIEMYRLDNNLPELPVSQETASRLVEAGYLQSLPTDPGEGSEFNLVQISTVNPGGAEEKQIACLAHGVRVSSGELGTSAREQFRSLGVTDEDLLSRASTGPLSGLGPTGTRAWINHQTPRVLQGLGFTLVFFTGISSAVFAVYLLGLGIQRLVVPEPAWIHFGDLLSRPRAEACAPIRRTTRRVREITFVEDAFPLIPVGARCPVCAEGYAGPGVPAHSCEGCGTFQHQECFEYTGRCGIYGCAG